VFSAAVIVGNLCQCVMQRLRFLKIRGSEAFGEPSIYWRKKVAGFGAAPLVASQLGEAHGGAQLPELGTLLQGKAQGLVIQFLGGLKRVNISVEPTRSQIITVSCRRSASLASLWQSIRRLAAAQRQADARQAT
jgi:hypothetical protein